MIKLTLPKNASDNFKRGFASVEKNDNLFDYGSPEHIRILEGGYGMTLDQAKEIVETRKANPAAYPYELAAKAQAMIEASKAAPIVVSKRPMFKASDRYHLYGEQGAG